MASDRSRPLEQRSWFSPVHGTASLVMAIGFWWAVATGWDDIPAWVMVPFGVASLLVLILSLWEIARRFRARR
jgi:hypothetical protein